MTAIPLTFGPLALAGLRVTRSEVRWLCEHGYRCRALEPVAICSLTIGGGDMSTLEEERASIRVTFSMRTGGRIFHKAAASRGGILGWLAASNWDANAVWGEFEPDDDLRGEAIPALSFYASRPLSELAGRAGSDGWQDRGRAWGGDWSGGGGSTVLGIGICEQEALLKGYGEPFAAMLAGAPGPVHIVHGQDEPLVPCARVLVEASARTADMRIAIRDDIARSLGAASPSPAPSEWMFAAALMNALERSPLDEQHQLITRSGILPVGKADAVCISLHGELPHAARHKRLGYTIAAHGFRLARAGPAIQRWMRTEFEPVTHGPDEVARDLRALIGVLKGRPLLVINAVSSQAYENIRSYKGFDEATMASLGTVRAKTLNLLLHELAAEAGIKIIDADAIVAEMGMAAHLPDGVHGSEAYYAELRSELLYQLAELNLPGFATPPEMVS